MVNDATLSVIIPAYNAAATLEALVQSCLSLLPRLCADSEVIIVNDGSSDATSRLANRLAATCEPVMVLHRRARGGYGAALAHGVGAARGDYIAALAADNTRGAEDLARLVPALDHAAVVVGMPQRLAGGAPGWLWGNGPRGSLLVSTDVLRGLLLASRSLTHAEVMDRARRAGYAVATVALPNPSRDEGAFAPRASFGETIELLRLRAQLAHSQPAVAPRPWQQKALVGGALAALLGGAWLALRRR